jgi:hypothetical protein
MMGRHEGGGHRDCRVGLHVLYDGCACHNSLEDKKGNDVVCNVLKRRYRRQSYLCVCVGI